jgi:hypothetical protein
VVRPETAAGPAAPAGGAAEAPPAAVKIARLEARVAALEAALERRSRELRLLQRRLCRRDLLQVARIDAGLPPLPLIPLEPAWWHETCQLTHAEVPETMSALWESLFPPDASS